MTEGAHLTTHSNCQKCHEGESFWKNKKVRLAMEILEKISLIALAAFAAYTTPKLFFPFFGLGVVLGSYLHWNKKIKHHHAHEHEEGGGCSQGFLEQLTGVKLPPPFGLAANIAITICHIDHHNTVFVPLTGLNAGLWIGKLIGEQVPAGYKRAVEWIKHRRSIEAKA